MPAVRAKLAVTEREAAAMLSLPRAEFVRLVACGALPRPVRLGDMHERWPVAALQAVLTGATLEDDEFEP